MGRIERGPGERMRQFYMLIEARLAGWYLVGSESLKYECNFYKYPLRAEGYKILLD